MYPICWSEMGNLCWLQSYCHFDGAQSWYTKYCLCLWHSRNCAEHYTWKDWPLHEVAISGTSNITNFPSVAMQNKILSPLHIKLGLIKQLVKGLDKESAAFKYLIQKFPALSLTKIKEGIFKEPDIRQLLNGDNFQNRLDYIQSAAWKVFHLIWTDFLGKHGSASYMDTFRELLLSYKALGCKMPLKVHFLMARMKFMPVMP